MDTQTSEQPVHLTEYLQILLKRRWVLITFFVIVVTVVTIGTFRMTPIYRATTQLLIEKEVSNVLFRGGVGIETSQQDYYQTQYKIIKSRSLAKKAIDKLGLQELPRFSNQEDIVGAFLKVVTVEPVRNSRLVNISVELPDPELSAEIVNTLAQTYVQQNLENKLFIAREILELFPGGKLPSSYKQINEISEKTKIDSLPSVINNRLIQELKTEHAKLEAEYADLSRRYKSRHPKIISIKAALKSVKQKIDLETKRIVESIKTELSGQLRGNNIRIVDVAEVPTAPIKPRKRMNILLAIFVGLMGGSGLAFFFEYLDNTIKTQEDIERYIGLPFLGYIPTIKTKDRGKASKDIITHKDPKSTVSEAFRTVRTGLMFSSAVNAVKSILITSTATEEGKTTVATNLAITLAQSGIKVLLVEGDMRRPSLHRVFDIKESSGLSDYLAGTAELESIMQKTPVENLNIIVCGTVPPNPSELLGLPKIKELVNSLNGRFDRVIFDAPPVIPVSDPLILSNVVDGVIFVVHHGKMPREVVKRGIQKIKEIGANILGVALNNIDLEKGGYYYPYYYHYYRYYGDSSKK
jgi:capsular exopolysaccharide synthesis family protein